MQSAAKPDEHRVLGEAVLHAGAQLGLSQTNTCEIIGRNRSSIHRFGIDPHSKAGELSLLLIRCYRALYALMGGNTENMQHFMKTPNTLTQGIPSEQIHRVEGLVALVSFLDAMRGRA